MDKFLLSTGLIQLSQDSGATASRARKKIRVAHLVSHPVQYLVPVYREISKHPEIDLTVYFYSDTSLGRHYDAEFGKEFEWSTELLGGYKHRMLPSAKGKVINQSFGWPNFDLVREVIRENYDVIWINSYIGTNALLMRAAAFLSGKPVFFRDDTNLLTPRPLWKRVLKTIALRTFLRGAWAFYVGEQSRHYWESYGIRQRRLFFAPHCVDNHYWASKARELAPQRAAIRSSFGITDDAPVILFCAKFIPKKQPLLLLTAFEALRKKMPCWLLLVGEGQLRGEIEQLIRDSAIDNTLLPGFLNQNELPLAYTAADLFVLPSAFNETWGLVVNEAMNFRLPIVVSDQVGCAKDLVKNGWNGFSFDYADVLQLEQCLMRLVENAHLRAEFGSHSFELIADYSVEACATGIVRAGCAASVAAT